MYIQKSDWDRVFRRVSRFSSFSADIENASPPNHFPSHHSQRPFNITVSIILTHTHTHTHKHTLACSAVTSRSQHAVQQVVVCSTELQHLYCQDMLKCINTELWWRSLSSVVLSMQTFNSTSKLNVVMKSQLNGRQVMAACTCGYHHHHHHHHVISCIYKYAVPNMTVFCSSLISCLLVMVLRNFLDNFEMVLFAPITITVTVFYIIIIITIITVF